MEASASIAVIESDLRALCQKVLAAADGTDWLDASEYGALVEKLQERKTEESTRRKPAVVPTSLLSYAHLYELTAIVTKRWQAFSAALGSKREFEVLSGIVEDFRNAPAHSRELLPYERDLLAGIAGLIRTKVITYMSTTGPDRAYYPVIESLHDSFGHECDRLEDTMSGIARTSLELAVGTVVSVVARGWDPHGRPLTWRFFRHEPTDAGRQTAAGDQVTFEYTVTEEDVGVHFSLSVALTSSGKFHRHLNYDHKAGFMYSVRPPSTP